MHTSPDRMSRIDRREALRHVALLLGGTLSAPAAIGFLAGCDGRREAVGSAAWHPRALTPEQGEMVATIAEHILPATDTPGARGAGVHEFIDRMLAEYYPPAERERFLAGLAEVDVRARRAGGRPFLECTAAEQRAVLDRVDQEAYAPPPRPRIADLREEAEPGTGETPLPPALESDTIPRAAPERSSEVPFFRTMKELTLLGYYTSEVGATQELRYLPVPGRYNGCVPLTRIGRTWAV